MSKELGKLGVQPSSSRRRKLLKQLGFSTAAGLFGGATLGGISPVAAGGGSGTTSSGPTVGTDEVIPAPDGGGLTDPEWDATNQEQDAQTSVNLGSYSNAGDLPIDYCIPLANGNDLCSDAGELIVEGTRNCTYGTTPTLISTDVTVQEYSFASLRTEITFWVGVNPNDGCVWVGQDDVGVCSKVACSVDDALDLLLTYATDWVDDLQVVKNWVEDNWGTLVTVGQTFTAFAFAVLVIILGAIIGGLLVAAGLAPGT